MKIKKCCHCKSKKIIYTEKEIYCANCGLVLAATYHYDAGFKTYYPYGLIYG
jgi:transcription initiation factor TFIIIB Brf1 subunit/transcription initiation factor TFIIB